uniref:Peptidase M14 domain-containing protein n=1 Tax=Anopheles maculatus TaxID=74869 RepID=A0A182TBZ0_9DIPT
MSLCFGVQTPTLSYPINFSLLAGPSNAIDHFLSYEETNEFLHHSAENFADKVATIKIGESALGRDINMIIINKYATKTVILVANLHAREWGAMTTALYIISQLIYNRDQYPKLMDFRWIIIPIANPDGYTYSMNYDRYWSKNRAPQPGGTFGVDLNRNFGYMWGKNENPASPDGRAYNGPAAFSEAESAAIGYLLDQFSSNTILFLDMHTFGNHIFYPWSYTTDPAPDGGKARAVGLAGADAMQARYGQHYTVGTSAYLFERVYGTSLDYCHSVGINVCLWFEMTKEGFQFEEKLIVRYGEEAWLGVQTMVLKANELIDVYYPE